MASGNDKKRTVLLVNVVDHDADRGEIVIGVRVKRPVCGHSTGEPKPAAFMLSFEVSKRMFGPQRACSQAGMPG